MLGPKLLTLYMLPMGNLARRHGVDFHLYADDSQLYIAFRKDNCLITMSKMELLINDIRSWMTHNKPKLNDDKSEIMVLNGARRPDITFRRYKLDTNQSLSDSIALLGVELDSNMSLKNHIRSVAKGCCYKLKNMFKIRRCITEDSGKTMVHSIITSKLDCNAIFLWFTSLHPQELKICPGNCNKVSYRNPEV